MAEIRELSEIKEKWTRVTPGRTDDYKIGIKNPRRDWGQETAAASDNYKAGVDAAHAKGMFAKGVKGGRSTAKWQNKALAKGPTRFAEGVYLAGNDYEAGYAPYREAIARATLPPRFPKRDPRNLERVKSVVNAMVAEKTKA